jgi:hypothetical protein
MAFAVSLCALLAGATTASASTYCSLDPTLGIGVPLVKLSLNVNLLGSKVYASTNGSSTTFGGGLLLP